MMKQMFKSALLLSLIGSVMFLYSCTEDEPTVDPVDPPVASFTSSVDGATVTLTNTSTGEGNTYLWDFGDDNTSTSSNATVTKTYTESDTYTITLTATNEGGTDTATEDITITVAVADTEAPVITLTGEAEIDINLGEEYTDAGATAEDNVDGTVDVTVGGDAVNTEAAGTYTITYDAVDAAGNAAAQVTRIVRVRFPGGLVANGDFEGSTDGNWYVNFGDNTVPVQKDGTNTFFIVNIETANADQPFTVNLSQVITIEQGKTYKLSFDGNSDVERGIIAGIGLAGGSFANNTAIVPISTSTMRYELDLRANFGEDGVDNRVIFDLAGETGVVVLDNIKLEETESTEAVPTEGAPAPPAREAADVISIYGDAYGTAIGLNNVPWDNPSEFEEVSIADNNALKISFQGFVGSSLGSVVDATDMTHFHMDFWIADEFTAGQVFNPKWSDHANNAGETSAFGYTKAIAESEVQTWVSIDIPMSAFDQGTTSPRANLTEFLITVAEFTTIAYIDNVYFYNDGSSSGGGGSGDAIYMDDLNNASSIDSWSKLANAADNANATVAYTADGGVDGSGAIQLTLSDNAGGAFIFRYTGSDVNYNGNNSIKISYQAKMATAVTGSAFHMQTQVSQNGGGVVTTNTFDTQNQMNTTDFVTITQDVTNVDGAGNLFFLDFNFATGGDGAGSVIIDNIKIESN